MKNQDASALPASAASTVPSSKSRLVRARPQPLALEQRIVFDAAGGANPENQAHAEGGPDVHAAAQQADHSGEAPGAAANNSGTPPVEDTAAHAGAEDHPEAAVEPAPAAQPAVTSIVFVDTSLAGWQKLADAAGSTGALVVTLDSTDNGVARVSEILSQYQGLNSIQFLTHGEGGRFNLGQTVITGGVLADMAGEIASWGGALREGGDILLWSCDLASTANGRAIVAELARLTGADVAASVDATGDQSLGGNWNLEHATGEVDMTFRQALVDAGYDQGLMAAPEIDVGGGLLNFNNRTLVSGSELTTGAVYKYTNVATIGGTQIDAYVTITAMVNASLASIDDNAPNGGNAYTFTDANNGTSSVADSAFFAPQVRTSAANGHVDFDITFRDSSGNLLSLIDFYNNSIDIDGPEFVEYGGFQSYELATNTNLVANAGTGDQIRFRNTGTDYTGLELNNQGRVQTRFDSITTLSISMGATSATNSTARQFGSVFAYTKYSSSVVVSAPTVNAQVTNDNTPTITGTVGNTALGGSEAFTVKVNGVTYTRGTSPELTVNALTWSLQIGSALADNTYDVEAKRGSILFDQTSGELVVDTTAPVTASIVVADTSLIKGETSLVTITFSETVTGFDNSDLTVQGGTLSNVSTSDGGKTWTATFTPTDNLEDTSKVITLNNAGVLDQANNVGTGTTTSNTYNIDTIRPALTISSDKSALLAGETALLTFSFSQAPTGFAEGDVQLESGSLSNFTQVNATTWTATYTPAGNTDDATMAISVLGTSFGDVAGNIGTGDNLNLTVNTALPTATIVVADTALKIGETTTVTITFSEAVTGVGLNDFTVPNGALSDLQTSDNITWTATLTPTASIEDTSNLITLNLTGVQDMDTNAGVGTASSNNYEVDTIAPTVVITAGDTSLKAGETTTLTFTFSEVPTGFEIGDVSVESGTLGVLTATADPKVFTASYTPAVDTTDVAMAVAIASSTYTDAAGNNGAAGSLDLNVDTQAPTAGGVITGSGDEDTAITGTLTATDAGGLTDSTYFTVTSNGTNGTATIDAESGEWSYTPNADYNGTDVFTVTITDDAGNTTTQVINITVAAVADIANDTATVAEDGNVVTDVLDNDDFEGSMPVISAVTQGANGTVVIVAGEVRYTPNANFNGTDSYTYTVTSGGVTETATVNVTVTQVDDAATITGNKTGSGNEDTILTGTLTATDAADGLTDGTYYMVTSAATNGTATIDAATGEWSYTPNADYNGTDAFTVTITDDDGNTTTQVINITVTAVADIADDTATVAEDGNVVTDVLDNDEFEASTPTITAVTQGTNGTVAIVAGEVRYTPNANFNGTDSYTYTVTSGGVTETATVNVTVTQVDDPATITGNTTGSGAEDTAITGTLAATDTADGMTDGTYYGVTSAASNGTASIDPATGAWSYTPNADYNGTDAFTVTITDDDGNTVTQVINITVTAVADIANDTATVAEDGNVVTDVLDNDDFEGSTPTITAVTQGTNGTVAIVAGEVRYTPNANFNGTDSYTYTVTSGGVTETATVNVTVTQVDDAATIGGAKTGSGNEDTVITGTLTATDAADGVTDGTYFTVTSNGTNGTATIDADSGEWSYTPNADYNGTDAFTVTITDDDGNTTTQVINITVTAVVDIANDTATVAEDGSVLTDVLDNDEFEGTATITAVTQGANGTVVIEGGEVRYTPGAGYFGTDSYTYTVTSGGVTETATVNVTVTKANAPTVISGGTAGSGAEDAAITGMLAATDDDGLTDGTHFTVTSNGTNGTATIDAASGEWSYTPTADFNGTDAFTVTITDDDGNTTTQVINITVNAVVDIADDTATVAEDGSVLTDVFDNDSFASTATITAVTQGANGTVVIEGGQVRYTPNANFNGTDSYTYTVTSGGVTETATVNVTITQVDDAATITGNKTGSGNEDTILTGTLTATDAADGLTDGTYYTVTSAATNGTATIDADSGEWSYTPNADYNGTDAFTVTITDDDGNTTTQVINVTVAAVVDIANDTATVAEDGTVLTDVLDNDSFANTATITAVTQGANGTVVIESGQVRYTPNANFNGTDSYTYTVTSGGVTETATVNVTVTQVDDAATIGGAKTGSGNEDTVITGTLTATDAADGLTDGTYFTVTSNGTNGTATIDADSGEWSYTPNADYNGTDAFTVTITDDDGNTTTQVINITVNAVVDITNDTATVAEDGNVVTDVLDNDSFEGTPTITAVTQGTNGTVAIVAGEVRYTPNANFNGTDSYTYTVTSGGVTETATVNVTVTQVDDAATITGNKTGSGNEDTIITGTLTATDAADGLTDGTYYTVTSAATNGTATIDADSGEWSYTPTADFNGTDAFTVTVTDDDGNTTTQVINITVNAVADIANDTATVAENGSVLTDVLDNDSFASTATITAVTQGTNGTVVIESGQVRYTPNANFNGTDSYTYTVTSGGVTETATVNVTVTQVDDAATIGGNTTGSGAEDTAITGTLTATDVADGLTDGTYFTVTSAATNGTASIDPTTGAWSYMPVADFNGTDAFTVTITDDDGNTTTQVINITVNAVVDIADDTATVAEDGSVLTDVLDNDSFASTATITAVTQGANGTVVIESGQVRYTPNANFNGTDSYTYTVTSGGVTETATVNVTVTQVDDAATITGNTTGSGAEDTAITGTLTATDAADGLTDGTYFTVTTNGTNGTATIDADSGEWTYTPNADYNGTDAFTVTITDDDGNTTTQVINITVNAVVDIADDTATVAEDDSVLTDVLDNDEFEGTAVITAVTQGTNGTVVIEGGQVRYTPNANFNGTDSYTYTVTSGGVTETATVNVTVTQVDDAATIGGAKTGSGNEDTVITGTLTATDAADGLTDGTYFTVTSNGTNGTATIDADSGEWSYTPNADYNGTDAFTVTITDDDGNTTTQVINITVNAVVDIADDTAAVVEDGSVLTDVLNNDSFEGTPVITAVTQGTNGTVVIEGGQVRYTPNADFHGTDSYTYTVTSGGVTETATVAVTVVPNPTITINDITPDNVVNQAESGGPVTITGTTTHVADGGVVTLEVNGVTYTGTVTGGTFSIDIPGADLAGDTDLVVEGSVDTPTSAGTLTGTATKSYAVDTTPPTPAITIDNVTADNFLSVIESGGTITLTGTVTGANDGDTVTLIINGNPYTGTLSGGTFAIDVPGSELAADGDQVIKASVTTSDEAGNTATATITHGYQVGTVLADAENDTLVIGEQDDTASGNVLPNDTGEGTVVVTQITSGGTSASVGGSGGTVTGSFGSLTINADGSYTYTLDGDNDAVDALTDGQTLSEVFTYTITDSSGQTSTATITIRINGFTDLVPTPPEPPAPPVIPENPAPPSPSNPGSTPSEPAPIDLGVGGIAREIGGFAAEELPVTTNGFPVVVIQAESEALQLFKGVPDQFNEADSEINFTIPTDSFAHTNSNARVGLAAILTDGQPLPGWLLFDSETGTFKGYPPKGFTGQLVIKVIARDADGREAEAIFRFNVGRVTPAAEQPTGKVGFSDQVKRMAYFQRQVSSLMLAAR